MAAVAILNLWFKNHLNIWNCLPTAVILSHNVGLSTFKRHLAKFNFSTFFHYTQLFLLLYVCLFQLYLARSAKVAERAICFTDRNFFFFFLMISRRQII